MRSRPNNNTDFLSKKLYNVWIDSQKKGGLMETMEVFVCERCKGLLMQIDWRIITYQSGELDINGEYSLSHSGDEDMEYHLCPVCSGTDHVDHDRTLKGIEIPKEFFKVLDEIWYEVTIADAQQPDIDKQVVVPYGIPLSNKRLKELLTEYLV